MSYKDLRKRFERDKEIMRTGNLPEKERDAIVLAWALELLFEIHGDLDSLSACYREMLELQKEKRK